MATITRSDFANRLRERFGLTSADAYKLVDVIFDEITESLFNGEEVKFKETSYSYDELLGKTIKNTDGRYFCEVTQTVDFYLNEKGCSLTSKATLASTTLGLGTNRNFYFTDTFIIFMKEKEAELQLR